MKTTVTSFEEAAKIALRVDSALWGSQFYGHKGGNGNGDGPSSSTDIGAPTPMEIGNNEGCRNRFKDPNREEDFRNNRCFVCYKAGCRAWKHTGQKIRSVNNIIVEQDESSLNSEEHRSDLKN